MAAQAMANMSDISSLPPLPSYTLQPLPPLVPGIPDKYLTLLLPIIAYWGFSMIFHYIDVFDLFPQYRLHTPAEVLKRNHVSRWEVVRDVVIQQVVQTMVGLAIASFEEDVQTGMDDYNIALWAQRLRIGQRALPLVLSTLGLDAQAIAKNAFAYSPSLAGALSGGQYPWLITLDSAGPVAAFAPWEMALAHAIYWFLYPAVQFALGIVIVDTWQYFLHRGMHMNKWLYTTFHARHHRLYVPYAYGALYNHPFEGFLLDTCGTGLAYVVSGMTPRQTMWFFTCSTIKTVDDHCGYALPWDPLQHITSNNAGYHDVHHQSWGIKTNFSQPFFTFWDRFLGTVWTGGDVSSRYERARIAAQKKIDSDRAAGQKSPQSVTGSNPIDSVLASSDAPYESTQGTGPSGSAQPQPAAGKAAAQAADSRKQVLQDKVSGGPSVLAEETAEEEREAKCLPASMRPSPRKSVSGGSQSPSLKGLRERVSSKAFHGRTGSMLGYESGR